jgi:hypothetical protein
LRLKRRWVFELSFPKLLLMCHLLVVQGDIHVRDGCLFMGIWRSGGSEQIHGKGARPSSNHCWQIYPHGGSSPPPCNIAPCADHISASQKFVARKARKFQSQGNRLALPALEIAYIFHAIAHAPQEVISSKMLPVVEALLLKLKGHEKSPSAYGGGSGYWDDYCLTKFLEGVCLRYMAHMVCLSLRRENVRMTHYEM